MRMLLERAGGGDEVIVTIDVLEDLLKLADRREGEEVDLYFPWNVGIVISPIDPEYRPEHDVRWRVLLYDDYIE